MAGQLLLMTARLSNTLLKAFEAWTSVPSVMRCAGSRQRGAVRKGGKAR